MTKDISKIKGPFCPPNMAMVSVAPSAQDDPRHPLGMHGASALRRRLALPHRAAGLGRHHGQPGAVVEWSSSVSPKGELETE